MRFVVALFALLLSWAAFADGVAVPIAAPQIGQSAAMSFPPQSGGGGGNSITYTETSAPQWIAGSASPQTFSGFNIGTASPYRDVIVEFSPNSTNPLLTLAINGAPATKRADATGSFGCEIWDAVIATGTTATLVATYTGGSTNLQVIEVGTVTGTTAAPTFGGTASVLAFGYNANPQTSSPALTIVTGGIAVACMTNATNVTLTSTNLLFGTPVQAPGTGNPTTGVVSTGYSTTVGSITPNFSAGAGYTGTSLAAVAYTP